MTENGKVALVAQDESYDIELAISYLQGKVEPGAVTI